MTLDTTTTTDAANRLRQGDLSYFSLWVNDVPRAATFFGSVLGWRYAGSGPAETRLVEGLGISHGIAEMRSAAGFMRQFGVPVPEFSAPTTYPVIVVDNIAAAIERVRQAGGWAAEPFKQPYGLVAACTDDQGLLFSVHEVPADAPAPRPAQGGNGQGDIAYLMYETPDAERARAFLGAVLGLQFTEGRGGSWSITGVAPMAGLMGGRPRSMLVPMYRVDDIRAAVERVRAAGGTASEPVFEGYGSRAECVDDQGLRFMLGQF